VVDAVIRGDPAVSACRSVVEYQHCPPELRWVPEPWSGHLDEASIIVVSSNPSSGLPDDAHTPDQLTAASTDDEIVHAFEDAFDEGPWPGIAAGAYLRSADGKRGPYVRYWGWALQVAEELLSRPPLPGRDYVLTELVHCGSRHEIGVWAAVSLCVPRYLERIMAASPARVVLIVGAIARDILQTTHPKLVPSSRKLVDGVLGGRERVIAYLPIRRPSGLKRSKRRLVKPVSPGSAPSSSRAAVAPPGAEPRPEGTLTSDTSIGILANVRSLWRRPTCSHQDA